MARLHIVTLFNLYAEYIMWNGGLDHSQAGRNINNLQYVDDATLMTESEEELEPLFFFLLKFIWPCWVFAYVKCECESRSVVSDSVTP